MADKKAAGAAPPPPPAGGGGVGDDGGKKASGGGGATRIDPITGLPVPKRPKAKVDPVEIELDYNFTLKPLFPPEFGLKNLELWETLSINALGRVRLVKNLDDGRFYALKMLKKSKLVAHKQVKNLVNEVGILSRLRCCFAPELKAVFQDENSIYVMGDYVAGGELFSHLRKNVFFEETVCQFYATEVRCVC
jgi:hypothetical protein